MEKKTQELIHLANKRFTEVLSDGFKLFIKTYKSLIIPLALFQIILIALNVLLLTDLNWYIDSLRVSIDAIMEKFNENISLTESELNELAYFLFMTLAQFFLQNLIGAVIITIAMCSVSNYVFKMYMHEDTSLSKSFKSAFNKKMLIVILILGISLPIGSFLLLFPAIIIFGFFIFLIFTYNIGDGKNLISEARSIAKKAFWKIIGIFVINVLFILIIDSTVTAILDFFLINDSTIPIISSWYNPATRNFGMLILYNILYSIVDIIFAPLFICLLTALFSSLKAKRDLKIQYQQGHYPQRELYQKSYEILGQKPIDLVETEGTTTSPDIRLDSRFYCPFCGVSINTPKKFCPRCGENLSSLWSD